MYVQYSPRRLAPENAFNIVVLSPPSPVYEHESRVKQNKKMTISSEMSLGYDVRAAGGSWIGGLMTS